MDLSILNTESIIIDRPLTPPATKSLGEQKRLKEIEDIRMPKINSKYLLNFPFL